MSDSTRPGRTATLPARRTRTAWWPPLLLGAVALLGCGDSGSGQTGSAFVFLTVSRFSLDGSTPVAVVGSSLAARNASTVVCVTLRNTRKNPTVTAATELDDVLIQSYTVDLLRLDGGAGPGPFTIDTAVIVPAGTLSEDDTRATGNTATFAIIVVPAQLKRSGELPAPLTVTARVTFRGRDMRGQRVTTEGAITVDLVPTGEDSKATCGGGTENGGGSGQPLRTRRATT